MVTSFPKFGASLVAYYKQLLPALNSLLQQCKKINQGRSVRARPQPTLKPMIGPTVAIYESMEKEVEDLLTLLEKTGGPVAESNQGSLSTDEVHDSHLPKRHL